MMISSVAANARRQLLVQALRSAADHFGAGRWDEAAAQARLALNLAPGDVNAINLLASATMENQCAEEAIPLFKRAVVAEPKSPFLRFNLGEAYRRTGAYKAAIPCFQRAAELKPDFAEAIALAAESLILIGRENEAEQHLKKALSLAPGLPSALHGLGILQLQRGAPADAVSNFLAAVGAIPPTHSLYSSLMANLGRAYLQIGDGLEAFQALARAIEARPDDTSLWDLLASGLLHTRVVPRGEEFRHILMMLLGRNSVNPRNLATAAIACLTHDEDVAELLSLIDVSPGDVEALLQGHAGTGARLVGDPLFRRILSTAPVSSVPVELLLVQLRSDLLAMIEVSPAASIDELELAICLAHQSFLNEYVQFTTRDEEDRVDRLIDALDRDDLGEREGDAVGVAIVAAYRPLIRTPLARQLAERQWPELANVLREQLAEPAQEASIRTQFPVLRPATNPTSLAVQRQYEESPYPRWTRCNLRDPLSFSAAIKRALPHLPQRDLPDVTNPRILIAGCGTGLEVMRVINSYRGASVQAVDLSAASLAYAARKSVEYGVLNVNFMQADILDLALLGEKFDLIESFGVLHHMARPAKGLEVLARLLKPEALLSIGLYSQIARRAVVEARAHIARQAYPTTLKGIQLLRRDLMLNKPPELTAVTSPASDFWTTSECRDLLFHVNEHHFTLPQIGAMLQAHGLEFLGIEFGNESDRTRYLSGQRSSMAVRDLGALHLFEIEHPEVFGDTYRIWAKRC
jgi:tetratricopeptide (TPR) repeat protein/SAM-dependent methyltransferase